MEQSSSNRQIPVLKATVSSHTGQDASSNVTSSFGDRTMKLTLNPSPSHMYNIENSVMNHSPRNISGLRPKEMTKLQMTYGDNDMKILIKR